MDIRDAVTLGAQIPDARTLAVEYSVSIRRVLDGIHLLEREGYVHCIPGGATFVAQQTPREFAPRVIEAMRSDASLSISDAAAVELLLQEYSRGLESDIGRADR